MPPCGLPQYHDSESHRVSRDSPTTQAKRLGAIAISDMDQAQFGNPAAMKFLADRIDTRGQKQPQR
jgi:hypothetical protein